MGYDLNNSNGKYFRWNMWGWAEVFNLACSYGWIPKGTEIHPCSKDRFDSFEDFEDYKRNHEGTYFSNDGQMVSSEDARAFSNALESSLDDIPDEKLDKRKSVPIDDKFMKERAKIWNQEKSTLVVRFSGESNKSYLKEFIEFLRDGAFYIY